MILEKLLDKVEEKWEETFFLLDAPLRHEIMSPYTKHAHMMMIGVVLRSKKQMISYYSNSFISDLKLRNNEFIVLVNLSLEDNKTWEELSLEKTDIKTDAIFIDVGEFVKKQVVVWARNGRNFKRFPQDIAYAILKRPSPYMFNKVVVTWNGSKIVAKI